MSGPFRPQNIKLLEDDVFKPGKLVRFIFHHPERREEPPVLQTVVLGFGTEDPYLLLAFPAVMTDEQEAYLKEYADKWIPFEVHGKKAMLVC